MARTGCLLGAATILLFAYVGYEENVAIPALLGGLTLPDTCLVGCEAGDVTHLRDALLTVDEAAVRYRRVLAGADRLLPVMVAVSFAVLGYLGSRRASARTGLIGAAIASVAAVPYVLFDWRENGIALALFSPDALRQPMVPGLTADLLAATRAKFAAFAVAVLVVLVIWLARRPSARQA